MIATLVLLSCLQTPQVQIKYAWTATSEASSTASAVLTQYHESGNFQFLRPSSGSNDPNAHDWCYLDAMGGAVLFMQTVFDDHSGTPTAPNDTVFSVGPTGERQTSHWDGTTKEWVFYEGGDKPLKFVEGLNHYLQPVDSDAAMRAVLPPMLIRAKGVGEARILSDGADRMRLVAVAGEVRVYHPHTWTLDKVLLEKGALDIGTRPLFDPQVIGNPQKGRFAISNGDPGNSVTAYFNPDLSQLDVPKGSWCLDASRFGFLIAPHASTVDAETLARRDYHGVQIWTRTDIHPGTAPIYWVGGYVAYVSGAVTTKGEMLKVLSILDGTTGKTVAQQFLPQDYALWRQSGLDDIVILTDSKNNYYGYRIETQ